MLYFREIFHLGILQEQMTRDEKRMDVVYLSLAGLKQVGYPDLVSTLLKFRM